MPMMNSPSVWPLIEFVSLPLRNELVLLIIFTPPSFLLISEQLLPYIYANSSDNFFHVVPLHSSPAQQLFFSIAHSLACTFIHIVLLSPSLLSRAHKLLNGAFLIDDCGVKIRSLSFWPFPCPCSPPFSYSPYLLIDAKSHCSSSAVHVVLE